MIVAIDDHPVKSTQDLFSALDQYQAGATVKLTVLRDGQRQEIEVTTASS